MTPLGNNGATLGEDGLRWADIFATNSSITSSDAKLKTDINYDLDQFDALFDALRPASYKFIDGTSGRTHMGMIAQDIESTLNELGISTLDFAAFIKSPTKMRRQERTNSSMVFDTENLFRLSSIRCKR